MKPFVEKVLNGEYNFYYEGTDSPIILDLGANVGSFAVWAAHRWPKCAIHCYEPSSPNYELLTQNVAQVPNAIKCHNVAVGDTSLTKLYSGAHNSGESSLFQIGEQISDYQEITTISATDLPKATILKLDVEGSELDILNKLAESQRLDFSYILLEYHSEDIRRSIDSLLKDYILIGGQAYRPHRGVLKYKRQ